jgi:hypothetical protein
VSGGLYSETLRPHISDGRTYPIFLSSGEDAQALRNRVERVVQNCLNAQLSHRGWPIQFPIWRWEDVDARAATEHDRSVNDTFVRMARESSVVIVLLRDELRPGTREELLAVKDDPDVDLKVLWFCTHGKFRRRRSTSVRTFLDSHRDTILYTRIDDEHGEEAWVAIMRNLVSTLLMALRSDGRDPYVEQR